MTKKISIVTPCYNEEFNVEPLYEKVKIEMAKLSNYTYEHIFIDNYSTDNTLVKLKNIASVDKNVKIIVNARNFGHIKSPYYGMLQADGDVVISLVSDLQDPPELIPDFIKKWEEGYKIVVGVKEKSEENIIMFSIRKLFYKTIDRISDTSQIQNFTGFGLYDRQFMDVLRNIQEPYPYFRGLVSEMGFSICQIPYLQPKRSKGNTKNNFFTLYDMAMLGFTSHSKVPLRMSSFIGFVVAFLSRSPSFSIYSFRRLYTSSDMYLFCLP